MAGVRLDTPLVLHGNNGSLIKGARAEKMLGKLGTTASYARPRASNDNACPEAVVRKLKYAPAFPRKVFASLEAAPQCCKRLSTGTINRNAIAVSIT